MDAKRSSLAILLFLNLNNRYAYQLKNNVKTSIKTKIPSLI